MSPRPSVLACMPRKGRVRGQKPKDETRWTGEGINQDVEEPSTEERRPTTDDEEQLPSRAQAAQAPTQAFAKRLSNFAGRKPLRRGAVVAHMGLPVTLGTGRAEGSFVLGEGGGGNIISVNSGERYWSLSGP